jgi:hypothetical protein
MPPGVIEANHIHISERESAHVWPDGRSDDGKWEDCAWTALVEFIRLAYRPDLPATHAFMESIRARVMGPLGGTIPSQLVAGAKTIGSTGPKTSGIVLKGYSAADLWSAMKPGTVACVAGSMGAFPSGHTLRRWDASFAGRHQVMAARFSDDDRVWWCDPLAPTGVGYEGQWVTKTDFLAFVKKLNSKSFVAPYKQLVVAPAPTPTTTVTYTKAQLDAAVKTATDPLKVQIAALNNTITSLRAAVASLTTRLNGVKTKVAALAADIAND